MKRNFLITTGIKDTWEFYENNFVLGKWCEFYEFDSFNKEKLEKKIPKKISIIKNTYHWDNDEKSLKDYGYLMKTLEYLYKYILSKVPIIIDGNHGIFIEGILIYSLESFR